MKKQIILIILNALLLCTYAQNGTYTCNYQRFTDDNNPEKNKEHRNSMIITINISQFGNGSVLISWPSEDGIYQWDILKKIDSQLIDRVYYSNYEARMNLEGIQSSISWNLVFIEDLDNNVFNIAITPAEGATTNWYHYLKKIQ